MFLAAAGLQLSLLLLPSRLCFHQQRRNAKCCCFCHISCIGHISCIAFQVTRLSLLARNSFRETLFLAAAACSCLCCRIHDPRNGEFGKMDQRKGKMDQRKDQRKAMAKRMDQRKKWIKERQWRKVDQRKDQRKAMECSAV